MKHIHKVAYYETDMMGITHHSNYIRWMEEARVEFFKQIGHGYKEYEDKGIVSPVVSVECQYKTPTTFDDDVEIEVYVSEYNGVRFTMHYDMKNAKTGDVVLVGKTCHCFLGKDRKLIIIKKTLPDLDVVFKSLLTNK